MLNIPYPIVLASKSPRRQQLLAQMKFTFKVEILDTDEWYPADLLPQEIAVYIAHEKAIPYKNNNYFSSIVITADTIVSVEDEILGKPKDVTDAKRMLEKLSGKTHQVITGVCILHKNQENLFFETTDLEFKHLSTAEIDFYIQHFKPFDKAGSYGVQDWIGAVGVKKIQGSYTNVMGLPTERLYSELQQFAK